MLKAVIPRRQIDEISFRFIRNKDERTRSASAITSRTIRSSPDVGSLNDPAMGVNNDSHECRTCQAKQDICTKHYGIIPLHAPILQIHKFALGEVFDLLTVTCWYCGKLRAEPETVVKNWSDVSPSIRLSTLSKALNTNYKKKNGKYLEHCGRQLPFCTVDPSNKAQIYANFPSVGNAANLVPLSPALIEQIFVKIDRETLAKVGKNPNLYNPMDFIRHQVHVLPVHLRNMAKQSATDKSNFDAITKVLLVILAKNQELEQHKEHIVLGEILNPTKPDKSEYAYERRTKYLDLIAEITSNVNAIVNKKPLLKKANAPLCDQAISVRLNSKHGIFRQDALGSRSNNRARGVIYNNPQIPLDCVALPLFFLQRLYVEETVTHKNYYEMRRLLLNSTKNYPGCLEIHRPSLGKKYLVELINPETFDLEVGDVVYRMLQEGDHVILNRQPSVLVSNMSVHRVIPDMNPGSFGIGINIEACTAYNADFDGDQMTVIPLIKSSSEVESLMLTNIGSRFTSYQNSAPIFGLSLDAMTLIAELTRNGVKLSRAEAMRCLENVKGTYPLTEEFYTGRELVSLVLPKIDYRGKSEYGNSFVSQFIDIADDEKNVVIEGGKLISGVLDKKSVSARRGSIFDIIYAQYGNAAVLQTIYNLQQLALSFGVINIFTISPRDFAILDDDNLREIHTQVSRVLVEANHIIDNFQAGKITAQAGKSATKTFENKLTKVLNVEPIEPILKALANSRLVKMIGYGSKGKLPNLISMCGVVGQSFINGELPPMKFDFNRTNMFSHRNDQNPLTRGFIPNSFVIGIDPMSYFANAEEDRIKIIRKALGIVTAGALARQMVRTNDSLYLNYLFNVMRNRTVVSWLYSDNGFSVTKSFEYSIPTIMLSNKQVADKYHFETENATLKRLNSDEIERLIIDRDVYRRHQISFENIYGRHIFTDAQRFPLDMRMFIEKYLKMQGGPQKQTDAVVIANFKQSREFINRIYAMCLSPAVPDSSVFVHLTKSQTFFEMYLRAYLPLKTISIMTTETFTAMLALIRAKFVNALEPPGSAVGIAAATANSEPVSQKQLDSHHVVGSDRFMQYTLPGIKDFISIRNSTLSGTAQMWARVRPEIETDRPAVERVARDISLVVLDQFKETAGIYWEKFGEPTYPTLEREREVYERFSKNTTGTKLATLSNYCIRITLDRHLLLAKGILMRQIVPALYAGVDNIFIVHSNENDVDFPLQLRVHIFASRLQRGFHGVMLILEKLKNCVIRGIRGIQDATCMEMTSTGVDKDGAIVKKKIYTIRTTGSNVIGLSNYPDIIPESIESTSLHETEQICGINYGRLKMIQEYMKILNNNIAPGHIITLVDGAVSTGQFMPLNRAGVLKREPKNVILNCGTGYPIVMLNAAATKNFTNEIYGVSSPLIMGQTVQVGTGYIKAMYDFDAVEKMMAGKSKDLLDRI